MLLVNCANDHAHFTNLNNEFVQQIRVTSLSFLAAGVFTALFVRFLYLRTQPGGVYECPRMLKHGKDAGSSLGSTPGVQ